MSHNWLSLSALLGGFGVALGAFGAHLLRPLLPLQRVTIFETGVRYHLFHVLVLLIVAILIEVFPSLAPRLKTVAWLFVLGILLFSGGLYASALSNVPLVMWLVPVGGLSWIGGWGLLALIFWSARPGAR